MAGSVDVDTESLVRDGGLEKTIVKKGNGDPAGKSAQVSLRYSMQLENGFEFDSSSKRRNGLLEFRLGTGKVIPAIELIAASMSLREKCKVTCSPFYAFGEKGLKRKGVPPNSNIIISAEMVRFEGGTPRKGLDEMSPLERFSEAVQFKEKGNKLFKETKFEKAVAEYSKAIRLLSQVFYQPMKPPAKADDILSTTEAISESLVSEEVGMEKSPADEPVVLDITTESSSVAPSEKVIEAESEACTNDEAGFQEAEIVVNETQSTNFGQLPEAQVQKDAEMKLSSGEGNDILNKAPAAADSNGLPSESDVLDLHVKTLNNLSLCCIKMGEFTSAEEGSSIAIRMDAMNSKALYNRGRARVALGKLEEARADFFAAAKINPRNMGIRTSLESVEKKLRQQKVKEKKQAEAMFA